MFKVDVFISKRDPFDLKQLERRKPVIVSHDPERSAYVASPEDIILAKLRWYRQTNEKSERRRSDVLGVISVQADKLDLEYLDHWARELIVADLLERALDESRGESI